MITAHLKRWVSIGAASAALLSGSWALAQTSTSTSPSSTFDPPLINRGTTDRVDNTGRPTEPPMDGTGGSGSPSTDVSATSEPITEPSADSPRGTDLRGMSSNPAATPDTGTPRTPDTFGTPRTPDTFGTGGSGTAGTSTRTGGTSSDASGTANTGSTTGTTGTGPASGGSAGTAGGTTGASAGTGSSGSGQ